MPSPPFAEITLPDIVSSESGTAMPSRPLPSACVPVTSVPM